MWFEPNGGFCIWCDQRAEEWGGGIPQITEIYDTLAIPYLVRVEQVTGGKQKKVGFTIVGAWDDLPALTMWVPSFQKQIDGARGDRKSPRCR